MSNRDLVRSLFRCTLVPLAVFAAVGCQGLHSSVPVAVTIRDAETKAAIPGAEVALLYPTDDSLSHPHDSTGKTDPSGVAKVQALAGDDAMPQIKIAAAGYLPEQKGLSGEALRAIKAADAFWSLSKNRAPIEIAFEVYRGPAPSVELIVANGYRGLVKVEVRIREDVVYEPGQRNFSRVVPGDGNVQVEGPPVLRYDRGPFFCARYADANATLPTENLKPEDIGFRWLRTDGRTEVFVIGNRDEWERYRRAAPKSSGGDSGAGKGGGGGGRRGSGGGS